MIKEIAIDIVKTHIDNWDPMGLLSIGAPDDEYEPEIEAIVNQFSSIVCPSDLTEIIQDTFNSMFSTNEFTLESCEKIARLIWKDITQKKVSFPKN